MGWRSGMASREESKLGFTVQTNGREFTSEKTPQASGIIQSGFSAADSHIKCLSRLNEALALWRDSFTSQSERRRLFQFYSTMGEKGVWGTYFLHFAEGFPASSHKHTSIFQLYQQPTLVYWGQGDVFFIFWLNLLSYSHLRKDMCGPTHSISLSPSRGASGPGNSLCCGG